MIKFINQIQEEPYLILKEKYEYALSMNQKNIEAISISSYSSSLNEVNSRYVNLKFVDKDNFIFFSNYDSVKSSEFSCHNQIAALIYWNSINTQIRLKAFIKKTSKEFNREYFRNRSVKKNALAISSMQSKEINSFDAVEENYHKSYKTANLKDCPEYWGGYSFTPYYFEFWEGNENRLNKRLAYQKTQNCWNAFYLQP